MESEGQGKRPPAPVLVEVTTAEVGYCVDFAMRCSRLRQYAGKPGWRGGLVSGMRLYGGFDADSSTAGIVIGKVAECAVCKLAGVPIDLALRDYGDGGKDLELPCGTTQVKASRKPYASKFIRDPIEQVPWFVFATWNGKDSQVSIDGYISRAGLMRLDVVPSPRGGWMNREVPMTSLLPVRSLLRIRPIDEVL